MELDQLMFINSDRDLTAKCSCHKQQNINLTSSVYWNNPSWMSKGKTNIFKSIKSIYYPYELIRRQSVACVLSKNPEENKKRNTSLRKYYVLEPKDYIPIVRKYLLTVTTHKRFTCIWFCYLATMINYEQTVFIIKEIDTINK